MMNASDTLWVPAEQRPLQRAVPLSSSAQETKTQPCQWPSSDPGALLAFDTQHSAPAQTDGHTNTHMQKNPEGSSLAPALISPCEMWVSSCPPLCPKDT